MLRKIWIELRSSLWFVPGLLVCAGIALALGLVELDVIFYGPLRAKSWQPLLRVGEEGARGMLAAIAGSMITVAASPFPSPSSPSRSPPRNTRRASCATSCATARTSSCSASSSPFSPIASACCGRDPQRQ